jgi:hypothetical protein
MTTRFQIKCINKSDRLNPHERIVNVGGFDNSRWKISQAYAVESILNGKHSFFVVQNGKEVEVVVATSAYGHKYIRTEPDNERTNNLLSLPECPP